MSSVPLSKFRRRSGGSQVYGSAALSRYLRDSDIGRTPVAHGTIGCMFGGLFARVGIAALLFACALVLAAEKPEKPDERPNVLLITVDTLRADHLSSYGYPLKTSPAIDRLAEEGARFSSTYSAIPLTGPSHISLFTSRFPQEHGARVNGYAVAEDSKWLFLPQILRRFGYTNAAFVSAWPLTSRLTHLDRWFDVYDEDLKRKYQFFNSSRYAEDVTPLAVSWLENRPKEPFFLWLHYFDPHSPYHPREGFEELESSGHPDNRPQPVDEEIAERIRNYDSEIAYTDAHIAKLLAKIDDLGLRDSTLVVLTSDHGESLGEHGYVGHGRSLSQGIVAIPLIMRYPGVIPAGQVIDDNVSLLDITPTLLGFTIGDRDEKELPTAFAGRSLVSAMTAEELIPSRPIRYVTFAGKKGWMPRWIASLWVNADRTPLRVGQTLGDEKAVWNPRAKSLSLVDVRSDPFEENPTVLGKKDARYHAEAKPLSRWFDATDLSDGESRMSERDVEVLKSLGYIH